MEMFYYHLPKLAIWEMVNNKQLMYTAPTVYRTLPFCIALCSVELSGLVVGHGPVPDFDGDGV